MGVIVRVFEVKNKNFERNSAQDLALEYFKELANSIDRNRVTYLRGLWEKRSLTRGGNKSSENGCNHNSPHPTIAIKLPYFLAKFTISVQG